MKKSTQYISRFAIAIRDENAPECLAQMVKVAGEMKLTFRYETSSNSFPRIWDDFFNILLILLDVTLYIFGWLIKMHDLKALVLISNRLDFSSNSVAKVCLKECGVVFSGSINSALIPLTNF